MPQKEYCETDFHLFDRTRVDLACDFLVHEFRKIFLCLNKDEAMKAIREKAPSDTNKSDTVIQDFWNLFYAMSNTWRHKDLTRIVTDASIQWEKRSVPIQSLSLESRLESIKSIQGPLTVDRIIEHFEKNPVELEKASAKCEGEKNKHPYGSYDDPLIAMKKKDTIEVRDGNGRLLERIVNYVHESRKAEAPQLTTWIGCETGARAVYWVATSSIEFLQGTLKQSIEQLIGSVSPLALREYQKLYHIN